MRRFVDALRVGTVEKRVSLAHGVRLDAEEPSMPDGCEATSPAPNGATGSALGMGVFALEAADRPDGAERHHVPGRGARLNRGQRSRAGFERWTGRRPEGGSSVTPSASAPCASPALAPPGVTGAPRARTVGTVASAA